ncbi:polyprenyl synthetase family protein [Actinomyces slackii]|nr:polyprenyl synthetase family protein [Actinomyces slackii]
MSDVSEPLGALRSAVESRLTEVIDGCRARWGDLGDAGAQMLDAAAQALEGGKRMRAVLGAVGAGMGAGDERARRITSSPVLHLGTALELYQASALVHDDVMDGALTRRGRPASHRLFAAAHAEGSWRGRAEDFGTSGAILLGDLLLSLASEEMGAIRANRAFPSPESVVACRAAFDAMTTEVALGQFLDVRSEAIALPDGADPLKESARMGEAALAVIRHKSARYSVQHPLLIGALLAGADPLGEAFGHLRELGEEIGIAFQLRDDELGVFGDPAVTGKPAGDDLREGKRTVLLSLAWGMTDAAGRRLLEQVLANRQAEPAELEAAARMVEDCGARAAHEEAIAAHRQAGARALAALANTGEADCQTLEDLTALMHRLIDRSA